MNEFIDCCMNGSWLKAQGSWLNYLAQGVVAYGSWPRKKQVRERTQAWGPASRFFVLAMSLEPCDMHHH